MGLAIAWYTASGYTVSIPLTDSQPYDLIVDDGTGLKRVSVKTATIFKGGAYQVGLRTQGGNKSQFTIRKFDPDSIELLFVACANGDVYSIPSDAFSARSYLTLGSKVLSFKG